MGQAGKPDFRNAKCALRTDETDRRKKSPIGWKGGDGIDRVQGGKLLLLLLLLSRGEGRTLSQQQRHAFVLFR